MTNQTMIKTLNDEQQKAVLHFDSPLLIIAGAGSGKTRVLTNKISYMITELGYHPQNILAVTFTNKAASEMKERIQEIVNVPSFQLNISTFHSLGLKILRENALEVGYDKEWTVIDDSEQKTIYNRIIKEKYDYFTRDKREALRKKVNLAKMNMLFPNNRELLLNNGFYDDEAEIYADYYQYMNKNKLWDYEDLISLPVRILQSNQKICQKYNEKFKYILVDEFQDTNPNQYELVRLIGENSNNITVVGDDDQAIYSWRGANVRFLLRFENDFPGAMVIKLERNYRSTKPILDLANELIKKNYNRKHKNMWTEKESGQHVSVLESYSKDDEAEKIAEFITQCKQTHPEYFPIAILYRINSQSLAFETTFSRRGIDFKIVKGLRFFQRKEIKDCIALLRLTMNLSDNNSFLRMVDVLPLGIGPKTQRSLVELSSETGNSLFEAMRTKMEDKFNSNDLFSCIFKMNSEKENHSLSEIMENVLEKSNYYKILEKKNEESRKLNIKEFINFLRKWEINHEGKGFQSLIDYIQLSGGEKEEKKEESVLLLTMHNAKGLEFPTVITAGINPSYMPFFLRTGMDEIEEERRLLYVALTRAVDKLIISTGSMRNSPFLGDISKSRYYLAERVEDLFPENVDSSDPESPRVKEKEVFIIHPIFGKGKVINSINETKHFIQFENGKEVVVDVSIVDVEFLKEES